MKIRYYQAPTAAPPKSAGPTTGSGWETLMGWVITRATETNDRRLAGLVKARDEGRSEKMLRSMGILSEADIRREFPG